MLCLIIINIFQNIFWLQDTLSLFLVSCQCKVASKCSQSLFQSFLGLEKGKEVNLGHLIFRTLGLKKTGLGKTQVICKKNIIHYHQTVGHLNVILWSYIYKRLYSVIST